MKEMSLQICHQRKTTEQKDNNKNHPTNDSNFISLENEPEGGAVSGEGTSKNSETSSVLQRKGEQIKKLEFEFEMKMRLERLRFEGKELGLDNQRNELESKRQFFEQKTRSHMWTKTSCY